MKEGSELVMKNAETVKSSCNNPWNFHTAFFLAGTVATTIGYGSPVPETDGGKIFCIFVMCVGIPYFAVLAATLAKHINIFISDSEICKTTTKLSDFLSKLPLLPVY